MMSAPSFSHSHGKLGDILLFNISFSETPEIFFRNPSASVVQYKPLNMYFYMKPKNLVKFIQCI
jgi:hypothetical protein